MRISKKADYALRAVVILAGLAPGKSMQAQELARTGGVPLKFLEQILLVLKRAGMLRSKRGVGGGYQLQRESRFITVAEVVEAIDGDIGALVDGEQVPTFAGAAGLVNCLGEAAEKLRGHLAGTTIEDLLEQEEGDAMAGYGI